MYLRELPEVRRAVICVADGWVDAVVGYRAWEVWASDGEVHLSSITRRGIEWPQFGPLEKECRCIRSLHRNDQLLNDHTCGIYAWAKPIIPYSPRFTGMMDDPSTYLAGEVLLWRSVTLHERGYRGQFAQPGAFHIVREMLPKHKLFIELAAHQFRVPIVQVEI